MTVTRSSSWARIAISAALVAASLSLFAASPLDAGPVTAGTPAAGAADSGVAQNVGATHRRDDLSLALVSRVYNASTDNWTIVADARLDSNRICLPIVFNCVVGELSSPSNATLDQLECQSPLWNHLIVFREHCLKQVFHAGHNEKFRFTWITDPGVNSGDVTLNAEFGRGFLPHTFQQFATASLTINLDVALDITKTCPDSVDSGGTLTCQVTVTNPDVPSGGPTIANIVLTDVPDTALTSFTSSPTLTFDSGSGTWTCSALGCNDGELDPGQTANFVYTATVDATSSGGDGVNVASVVWTGAVSGGPKTAQDSLVIKGNGDTELSIDKSTSQTQVSPGQPVSWSVVVTNEGPLTATDVELTDIAPTGVDGVTITHDSGVGTWSCTGLICTSASMPVGSATFTVSGTVAAGADPDSAIINEVAVTWSNDILGSDFHLTAGSAIPVVAAATTTTTTAAPTMTAAPGSGGAPLSPVG